MKELKRMNWTEWWKSMNSNEWIDMNELKRTNWTEWIWTNDLKSMIWNEWLERNELPNVPHHCFAIFMWIRPLATVSRTFCRPHLPKVLQRCPFFTIFMLNRALATVSCTFCRPHLPKVVRKRKFFYDSYV